MTKMQTHFGSKQIVFGFLFDSTFEPALSIVSRSLVAGLVRGRQSASDLAHVQSWSTFIVVSEIKMWLKW